LTKQRGSDRRDNSIARILAFSPMRKLNLKGWPAWNNFGDQWAVLLFELESMQDYRKEHMESWLALTHEKREAMIGRKIGGEHEEA
jgi:hypothetical protein